MPFIVIYDALGVICDEAHLVTFSKSFFELTVELVVVDDLRCVLVDELEDFVLENRFLAFHEGAAELDAELVLRLRCRRFFESVCCVNKSLRGYCVECFEELENVDCVFAFDCYFLEGLDY